MGSVPFFSLGSRDFLSSFVCPSRPDPCENYSWVPLSSIVVWLFFCSPSSRLSFFSLPQALGKHKPRRGLWFPLCFPGRAPRLRPVHLRLPLHQGITPAPVVFFLSLSRRWWWGSVCLGGGGPLFLSLSLPLSLSALLLALHVCLR